MSACPKCGGKGGFGAFGACGLRDVHFRRNCPLCNGSCSLPPGTVAVPCGACQTHGGMGAFGPCERDNVHYRSDCGACQGRGYTFGQSGGFGAPSVHIHLGAGGVNATFGSQAGYPAQGGYPAGGAMPAYPAGGAMPAYPVGGTPAFPAGGGMPAPHVHHGPHGHHGHHGHGHHGVHAPRFSLVKGHRAPAGCVQGHQNDSNGVVFVAIAHTNHGEIPGKAKDRTCWYSYGGKEHSTNNFSYLVAHGARRMQSPYQPPDAIQAGFQNDGAGALCCVIAHTPHGDIPGKAKGNTCWYPYGGNEHQTSNFSWICQ